MAWSTGFLEVQGEGGGEGKKKPWETARLRQFRMSIRRGGEWWRKRKRGLRAVMERRVRERKEEDWGQWGQSAYIDPMIEGEVTILEKRGQRW